MKIERLYGFTDVNDKASTGKKVLSTWAVSPLHISSLGVDNEKPNKWRSYRLFLLLVRTVDGKTYFKEFDQSSKRDEAYNEIYKLMLGSSNLAIKE